jgi:hypothetical protein
MRIALWLPKPCIAYFSLGHASMAAEATENSFCLVAPSRARVDIPWITAMT